MDCSSGPVEASGDAEEVLSPQAAELCKAVSFLHFYFGAIGENLADMSRNERQHGLSRRHYACLHLADRHCVSLASSGTLLVSVKGFGVIWETHCQHNNAKHACKALHPDVVHQISFVQALH